MARRIIQPSFKHYIISDLHIVKKKEDGTKKPDKKDTRKKELLKLLEQNTIQQNYLNSLVSSNEYVTFYLDESALYQMIYNLTSFFHGCFFTMRNIFEYVIKNDFVTDFHESHNDINQVIVRIDRYESLKQSLTNLNIEIDHNLLIYLCAKIQETYLIKEITILDVPNINLVRALEKVQIPITDIASERINNSIINFLELSKQVSNLNHLIRDNTLMYHSRICYQLMCLFENLDETKHLIKADRARLILALFAVIDLEIGNEDSSEGDKIKLIQANCTKVEKRLFEEAKKHQDL
jgi:hypothetical protein